MPSLSFFIDNQDLHTLVDRLNADPEIAFIVPIVVHGSEGRKLDEMSTSWTPTFQVLRRENEILELGAERREPLWWKAVRAVEYVRDGEHSLWHVPAGPLPLIDLDLATQPMRPLIGPEGPGYPPIPDPWTGWMGMPGFGPGCHPWIRLKVHTRHRPYTQEERASGQRLISFWLNDHDLLAVSDLQWTGSHFRPAPPQTQRWWNRMRGWVDRSAVRLHSGFWAFPSALQKLKDGMQYYSRNFDLDDAIRNAEAP